MMAEKEEPGIIHLSLRLASIVKDDLTTDLGIAVYFIFGIKEKPETCHEYGMAFGLTRKKFEELMAGHELLIHEVDAEESRLKEGQSFPINKLEGDDGQP
jgi:hypothetical protein